MPLAKGQSRATIGGNIREMEASGHPHNVAVAAALHTAYPGGRKVKRASEAAKKLARYQVSRRQSAPAVTRSAAAAKSGHTPKTKAPLGSGGRFAALKGKLAARPGVRNPGALAAAIGRKKYGATKMGAMAAAGRAS